MCAISPYTVIHDSTLGIQRPKGDEITMFLVPCLQDSISTLSGSSLAISFAVELALVSMMTITVISSLSVFSWQRTRIFCIRGEQGRTRGEQGYTLRCCDLTCGYFRGCRTEADV